MQLIACTLKVRCVKVAYDAGISKWFKTSKEVYRLQTTNAAKQNKANGISTEYDTIPFVVNGTSNVEISLQPWPI